MSRLLIDAKVTQIASWIVILCPIFLLAGVIGNELPVSIVAALFLLHSYLQRDWAWTQLLWVRLLLLLWAYISVRSAAAEFWQPALALSVPWIRFPLFAAALVCWILPDTKTQQRLKIALLSSVTFLIFDTLFQHFFGHDIFGRPPHDDTYYVRLTGPFDKPRVGVITMWLLIPTLGLLASWYYQKRWKIALATLLPLAGIAAIYVSGERMAFLLTLVGCGLLFLFIPRIRLLALVLGVFAAVTIISVNISRPEIKARQVGASTEEISGFSKSAYGRLWISAAAMAKEHPIFGVGARNFRNLCPREEYGPSDAASLDKRCGHHPHNLYLEWLAEQGIIGLTLFLAVVVHWMRRCWRVRHAIFRDPLLAGLVAAILIRLWPISVVSSHFISWSAMPFWLMVGWLMVQINNTTRKNSH